MEIMSWIVVGLIASWLAGQILKGASDSVLVDVILGILAGIMGGWIFGLRAALLCFPALFSHQKQRFSLTLDPQGPGLLSERRD